MTFWGSITAKGTILPDTIRRGKDQAEMAMRKEPLAVRLVPLDVRRADEHDQREGRE